ncbi:MAG: hypothetical protein IJW40_05360 [Clostridia bacterium]|nr:hypothetical protein [Clostridia bacterium]
MKKQMMTFVLAMLLLFLSACTPVSDNPPPPSEEGEEGEKNQVSQNDAEIVDQDAWDGKTIPSQRTLLPGHRSTFVWENHDVILTNSGTYIDINTGEEFSICFDPLCEAEQHNRPTCPQMIAKRSKHRLVSPYEGDGSMVLYMDTFVTNMMDGVVALSRQFVRYDQKTQTIKILSDPMDLVGNTWYFDPYTRTIYFTAYRSASESDMSMYSLDTTDGEVRLLCDTPVQMFAGYIEDDILYMNGSRHIGYVDLMSDEPEYQAYDNPALPSDFISVGMRKGYLYYSLYGDTTTLPLPDGIEEKYPGETERSYYERTSPERDFYRIDLRNQNAVPEPLLQNVGLVNLDGDYLFCFNFEPQYFYSLVSVGATYYLWDDPDAPHADRLHHFATCIGKELRVIRLDTMETCYTIELQRYNMPAVMQSHIRADGTGFLYTFVEDYTMETMRETRCIPNYDIYLKFDPADRHMTEEDFLLLEPMN